MSKFLWILLFLISSEASVEDFWMPQNRSVLKDAVEDVIVNFYMNRSLTVHMFHAFEDGKDKYGLEDDVNKIVFELRNKIAVQVAEYSAFEQSTIKKLCNVLFCDTYSSFLKILEQINPEHFEYQGFYLIAVMNHKENIKDTMKNIFETLWAKHIVNVNILWEWNNYEALMYTYYPYRPIYCGKAFPVLLNQYRSGKWVMNADYFPNKMENLFGCTLRVAIFSTHPFIIIKEHGNGDVSVDGIDGILLQAIAAKMNFKIEFVLSPELWGTYNHGSPTGKFLTEK